MLGHALSWHYLGHLWGMFQVYISSRSLDGGFLFQVDWHRTTGAVLVRLSQAPVDSIWIHCSECNACSSSHGVCGVGTGAAGVGVAGATVCSLTAWVAGAGAISPIPDVLGSTASGTHLGMWLWACWYCHPLMIWTRYHPWSASQIMVVGSHKFPASLRIDTVCLAKNGDFLWQPHWSWYVALWEAHWFRLSQSALAWGLVCLIHWGTVLHSAHWYIISTGYHRSASTGMQWYGSRAKYGSCPEHLAWVSNPLKVFMAASAWPSLQEFWG